MILKYYFDIKNPGNLKRLYKNVMTLKKIKRLLWLEFCSSDFNRFTKYELIKFEMTFMDFQDFKWLCEFLESI